MPAEEQTRREYWRRINRAIDYIDRNIDRPLTLTDIAEVASFSPYHFHRLFGALVGEPLSQFIQRLRMERAAALLLNNLERSVTEIAFDCGYTSPAAFARAFKETYGMSAGEWRKNGKTVRKPGKADGNSGKDDASETSYPDISHQNTRSSMETTIAQEVRVEELPDQTFAYVRHIGPYAGDAQLFQRLFGIVMRWAGPRGLIRFPKTKMITMYHDDPGLTDPEKLRTSVGITVPPDTQAEGEISTMVIPKGKYALARYEIDATDFGHAWDDVCGRWLPDSGYQPADGPCFEIYLNDPAQHPEHKFVLDICIPVKPL